MRTFVVLLLLSLVFVSAVVSGVQGAEYEHCDECAKIVRDIDVVLHNNVSVDVIEFIIEEVCIKKNGFGECQGDAQCKAVCDGMISEYGVEVIGILTSKVLDPLSVCAAIDLCPPVNGTQPSFNHTIVYQNLTNSGPVPKYGHGRFLQLTDVHLDPMYREGLNSMCGEPLCCRVGDGPGPNASASAGKWGAYTCDTPDALLENLLAHLQKLQSSPDTAVDFVLWTGDEPPHNVWNQSRSFNLGVAGDVASRLRAALPDIKFYPTLGNHASFPVNQFRGPPYDSWLYDGLANGYGDWLPASAHETFRYGGYYTVKANPTLRIVSLNGNYYLKANFWLIEQNSTGADVAGQLTWLDNILMQASQANEQVFIIAHEPPGKQGSEDAYTSKLQAIIQRYATTVVGQFFGHTHQDSFEVGYGPKPSQYPTQIAYVAPSVTPFTDINPSFRVYEYAVKATQEVTDVHQYRIDLETANKAGSGGPSWDLAYTATSYYGLPDATAASWDALARRMLNASAVAPGDTGRAGPYALLCSYLDNHATGRYTGPCDAALAVATSCTLRSIHPSLYKPCLAASGTTETAAVLAARGIDTPDALWEFVAGPGHSASKC